MRPSLTPSPHTDLPTVFADAHLRVVAHYNDATMPGDDNAACQLLLKRSMVFACAHMAVCLLFTVHRLQPEPSCATCPRIPRIPRHHSAAGVLNGSPLTALHVIAPVGVSQGTQWGALLDYTLAIERNLRRGWTWRSGCHSRQRHGTGGGHPRRGQRRHQPGLCSRGIPRPQPSRARHGWCPSFLGE
jgi:hypothetical protein